MEYRFQAAQELTTFIIILCSFLSISLAFFFGSLLIKRLEKLFTGSLTLVTVSFGVLILISNVNTYAETFDMKALDMRRYEAYGGIVLCLLIFITSGIYWRKTFKK